MQMREPIALAEPRAAASPAAVDDISIRSWPRGEKPVPLAGIELTDDGVIHFDVRPGADPTETYEALRSTCGADLTPEMVVDLLDPDPLPKIKEQDEDGRIRAVSAFAVSAVAPPTDAERCSGRLAFELVEFLANGHWLVTCSHMAKSYAGAGDSKEAEARTCASLVSRVTRRWMSGDFQTAGDLGTLFLHEMTCTYSDAWRELNSWLDCWERGFYDDPGIEQDTLRDLRGLVTEFRARLNAINVPRDEAGTAWFSGVTKPDIAERADRHIDRALGALDRLGDMLRGAYGLIQANTTARQLVLAEQRRKDDEHRQRRLDLVTAGFVVPTLIAGTWGENTWVPGQHQSWGFVLTVVTMIAGGLLVFSWLRTTRMRREAKT